MGASAATEGLRDRRLLVVGASAGIGRAAATAAVGAGAEVVFAARRLDRLEEAVAAAGGGHALALDVTDEASIERGVGESIDLMGGLDGFLYLAGMSPLAELAQLDAERWHRILATNVVGAALVAARAIPALGPDGVGGFVSSIAVGRPRRGLVAYSASKAALDELVSGLRAEHRDVRFVRIVVGDTTGTEFGEGFEPETMSAVLNQWIAEAHLYARQMDAGDLGRCIVSVLAAAFDHPGIALSDVRFEPPGGPLTLADVPAGSGTLP
jgi:NAD(P)-dependent dehydrogenase (short-subunit alcohol dehydrogenase family)